MYNLVGTALVELVKSQKSFSATDFSWYQQLVEIYLGLQYSEQFLMTKKMKIETPETIRTSLQLGEWVTSIDFKDAFFHILIQTQTRKYLRFHVQAQSYQFKALPLGVPTAPTKFMVIAKVKWMALHEVIRIHQYLDDKSVKPRSHQTCLQYMETLVALCQELGWIVNIENQNWTPNKSSIS